MHASLSAAPPSGVGAPARPDEGLPEGQLPGAVPAGPGHGAEPPEEEEEEEEAAEEAAEGDEEEEAEAEEPHAAGGAARRRPGGGALWRLLSPWAAPGREDDMYVCK